MFASLVLPPLGRLRFGLTSQVGIVIGGVEEQEIGGWRPDLLDALEKLTGNRVQVCFGHPIPFFPIVLTDEFVQIDRLETLDCCLPCAKRQVCFY